LAPPKSGPRNSHRQDRPTWHRLRETSRSSSLTPTSNTSGHDLPIERTNVTASSVSAGSGQHAPPSRRTDGDKELLGQPIQRRPQVSADLERKAMARALVTDLRRIDRALVENRAGCAGAVAASGTTLTTIFGISEVLAAKILGHTGDVGRFASADCFASYSGTAPIEVSSGEVTTPPVPERQSVDQQRAVPRRSCPDDASGARPRPLRAQTRRAQVVARGSPESQAPTGEGRLSPSRCRSGPSPGSRLLT